MPTRGVPSIPGRGDQVLASYTVANASAIDYFLFSDIFILDLDITGKQTSENDKKTTDISGCLLL